MNDDEITNGQRAAVAMDAIGTYARFAHPMEFRFFFLQEWDEADPEAVKSRLGDLLCGLMHYAEQRGLHFDDVLTTAQFEYERQRTWHLPGDSVQLAPGARQPGPDGARVGEILKARPGSPPAYLVDFIACRAWYREPDLTPVQHFPALSTRYGDGVVCTAYSAQHCLKQAIGYIQDDRSQGTRSRADCIADVDTCLSALSDWSGMPRPALLRSLGLPHPTDPGEVPLAAPAPHPVSLAAADVAAPPDTAAPGISHVGRRRPPIPPAGPATGAHRGGSR